MITEEDRGAVMQALLDARDAARKINTDDNADLTLRDRVIDVCDAAEAFLDAGHPEGPERALRDMLAATDEIGDTFAKRHIEGDDIAYLRGPFDTLDSRLNRVWRRMEQTAQGRAAVQEAQDNAFDVLPAHPAQDERGQVIQHSTTTVINVDNSVSLIKSLNLPNAMPQVLDWLTFLRDTLRDERFLANLLKLQALAKNLKRGALGLSLLALRGTLNKLAEGIAKVEAEMPGLSAQIRVSVELALASGRHMLAAAEALKQCAYAAADQANGPIDLTPWPSGMRLLPPVSTGNEAAEVELAEVRRFDEGHKAGVYSLAALSSERFMTGGYDGVLRQWTLGADKPIEMRGHFGAIEQIAVLDSQHVISASSDKTLMLWDVGNGARLRHFHGHEDSVKDVSALSPTQFLSASVNGEVCLWHRDQDEPLRSWNHKDHGAVAALSSEQFVSGAFDHAHLYVRRIDQKSSSWHSHDPVARTWKLAARDARSFISIKTAGSSLHLWSLDKFDPIATLNGKGGICDDVALLSTARAVSAHDKGLALWALPENETEEAQLLKQLSAAAPLRSVRALPSPDPALGRLIVGGAHGYLAYWEMRAK